ncbi:MULTISPECIES: cation diffusion facilitator family transporter [unclassified Lentimicrobium]|uniref:cation diffusion facilitator family transporter n=1 Tax=unclassified Lentimicrobium TaxID=2677434 RepID=UPI001554FF1A|nr:MULTISPECIES: cation diffusion facilitator family transporter [unclassified Lentimicrobium]NPD47646.1 cation transporter [Lentimicrobium sp. S6]NPD86522.1 cation transporter [Lentimicrobium sp. L6]
MDKNKAGYLEGIISILVNTGLFGLKLWAGIVSGSIALTADAWHTLSDSMSSIIVILGIKLSSKKADKDHPFGHGRWEQIAAIFIGFLLALIAFDFFKDSIFQFNTKESANFGTLAIVVTIISIVLKEGLAQYAFYVAKKTNNLSVKADGWHHRTDALSSVVVLIGIFFADRFWWIDSVLGIIIAGMLFYAAYEIIKDAINKLLGETPSEELITKIEQIIKEIDNKNYYAHHFHIHNYVSSQELTFHIKVDNNMSVWDAHLIATKIENKIKDLMNMITTIHIEPKSFEHDAD